MESLTSKDKASISEYTLQPLKARAKFGETLDLRADVVNAYKEKIDSGNYEVPIHELVKRLISHLKSD